MDHIYGLGQQQQIDRMAREATIDMAENHKLVIRTDATKTLLM